MSAAFRFEIIGCNSASVCELTDFFCTAVSRTLNFLCREIRRFSWAGDYRVLKVFVFNMIT